MYTLIHGINCNYNIILQCSYRKNCVTAILRNILQQYTSCSALTLSLIFHNNKPFDMHLCIETLNKSLLHTHNVKIQSINMCQLQQWSFIINLTIKNYIRTIFFKKAPSKKKKPH